MKSEHHIPPWITKKIPHQAKDTKMDIDEKGKGKEKETMIEKGSMNKSGMSTTPWFTYHNKLINYWISDKPTMELGETYNPDHLPGRCGSCVRRPKACLIQQDYHNINKDLIPPWKLMKLYLLKLLFLLMWLSTVEGKWGIIL